MRLAICVQPYAFLVKDRIYEIVAEYSCMGEQFVLTKDDPPARTCMCGDHPGDGHFRSRFRFLNDPDSVKDENVEELYTPQLPKEPVKA